MGCGCRKTPRKISTTRKALIEKRMAAAKIKNKERKAAIKESLRIAKTRTDICTICEYSKQDTRDKKYNIVICHKCNRPLPIIFKDKNFKCPIGKF